MNFTKRSKYKTNMEASLNLLKWKSKDYKSPLRFQLQLACLQSKKQYFNNWQEIQKMKSTEQLSIFLTKKVILNSGNSFV